MNCVRDTIAFLLARAGDPAFNRPLDDELIQLVHHNHPDHTNANNAATTLRNALALVASRDTVTPCLLDCLRLALDALEPYAHEMESLRAGKLADLLTLTFPQAPQEGFPSADGEQVKLWGHASRLRSLSTLQALAAAQGKTLTVVDTPAGRVYRLDQPRGTRALRPDGNEFRTRCFTTARLIESTIYYQVAHFLVER